MAGGTGRLGARIVRELLAASPQLRLRAGVRDVEKAKGFLDMAIAYGLLPAEATKRVVLVEADLTDKGSIIPAIGNASKVGPQGYASLPLPRHQGLLARVGPGNVL